MNHAVVLALLASIQATDPGAPRGIGVLGDSYSDEYAFYPPDRSTALNWVEILARQGWNFGPSSDTSRGEPRNEGFAYNWARSDATTSDALKCGQHIGLADQIRRGDVDLVVVFIGGNDFIHALSRRTPGSELDSIRTTALANIRTALDTLLDASPETRVVLGTVPDIGQLPEFAEAVESGHLDRELLAAYTRSLRRFNDDIRALARREPRVALVDFDTVIRLATITRADTVSLFGHRAHRTRCGNGPDYVFLADRRHIGTLTQATMARLVATAANTEFDLALQMPGDQLALKLAGVAPKDEAVGLASVGGAEPAATAPMSP